MQGILRRGKWLQENRKQLIRYLNINTKERIPPNFPVGNEYCLPGCTVILYLPGFIMFWTSAFTSKDVLTHLSDRCPFIDGIPCIDANSQDSCHLRQRLEVMLFLRYTLEGQRVESAASFA